MITAYTYNIEEYLISSEIIDYGNAEMAALANELSAHSNDKLEYIKAAYEYVRDNISHSADINGSVVTCTASEVQREKQGICFAKSHLLAALLRIKGIPTGFCYQRLILDDDTAPYLIIHGLNGVYLSEYSRWIRLDARGNKPGVDAQFSITDEQLAFPIRPELGEEDIFTVYPEPDKNVIKALKNNQTLAELWDDLPHELAYRTI
ncbi:MAG: transglutaminase domain-containing protein [Clostridiales bacterium]|nr:transglutaminase domain-containing protein [Clostridiales bacterium]